MKFLYYTSFLFLLCFSHTHAQVTMDSERDKDGNVLIYATNTQSIPYSVILNFSNLQNLSTTGGGNVTAIAPPGRSMVCRLKPTVSGQGTGYNYSYTFAKGNVFGKNKTEPIYLIPVPQGEKVTGMQMTHIENKLGADRSNQDYVGVSFRLERPTQILAPRKGVIAEVVMNNTQEKENLDFSDSENRIEIYHHDGTITRLMVLKAGTEKVKVGDIVYPGDVLAESSGENYLSGMHVRMVTLRTEKDGPAKFKYNVIPVKFATETRAIEIPQKIELVVTHPLEVVRMEMNKKELKQLEEKGK